MSKSTFKLVASKDFAACYSNNKIKAQGIIKLENNTVTISSYQASNLLWGSLHQKAKYYRENPKSRIQFINSTHNIRRSLFK